MTVLIATRLRPDELGELARLLDAACLPSADLAESDRMFFRFGVDHIVGYGGLEGEGTDRLLRSVVVLPDRRGLGVGRAMVAAFEQEARELGVQRLHLLTTTAAPFFSAMGYAAADRDTAPSAIASSREFTSLCPASADYLVKAF
ncbi:GNAT family N-acetyltransferase (plasmid) [Sphingomonas aliaeris]|uniref:GNAT family N-acetyltransferase n=1 Tax=Sphingomonas aliaeris TaxID=2759526 RepID=A0A974NYW3_9SPHN|nr:arsenic resistance N-acetyltransferase ArsN2 [Sphingomonas aliaeris]QQV79356.1 GNAT family N-acetyltransferase [Sphingomonas aliaeris]